MGEKTSPFIFDKSDDHQYNISQFATSTNKKDKEIGM